MGLINSGNGLRVTVTAILLLAGSIFLHAQNPGRPAGQLGTEIQNLEQKLNQAGISPAERHEALSRLAGLRQLSGDIAGAAVNWLDAASADPSDEIAFIAAAFCLAAIGEWETAALTLQPLLQSGRRGTHMLHARYLDASLRTWITNNVSALVSLAENPEFTLLYPVIYYTLWRSIIKSPGITTAGSAELWKSRLLAEFPKSPEARAVIAETDTAAGPAVISAVQSPLWLLFPGAAANTVPAAPASPPPPQAAASQPQAAPLPSPVSSSAGSNGIVLQTGIFSREANALIQAEALKKAGFTVLISRKTVNGTEHWAVAVPAGQDSARTAQDLKKAGFDSFPVKN